MKTTEFLQAENYDLAQVTTTYNGKQTLFSFFRNRITGSEGLTVYQGNKHITGSEDKNYLRSYLSGEIPAKLEERTNNLKNALYKHLGLLPTIKAGDQIVINAKRWFDKLYGNTYHSVRVYHNGNELGFIPFEYGYGNHYLQTAKKIIERETMLNVSPKYLDIRTLEEMGVKVVDNVTDVTRKKDLQNLY